MGKKKNTNSKATNQPNKDDELNLPEGLDRIKMSDDLLDQFARFYEYHPAKRFSRNLRSLVLEFLMYDGSAEAEYLRELVIDLDGLYSLLDAMEDEQEKNSRSSSETEN